MNGTPRTATLLGLALAAACAHQGPHWTPAGGSFTPPSGNYTVDFPEGWLRLTEKDTVLASREGVFLQQIDARTQAAGKPLRANSKKVVTSGMLPQEVAEVVRDLISSSPGMAGMTVLENVPATLDGHSGFKLAFSYVDGDGLKMKAVVYGALAGETLYVLSYRAPSRHYFERDLQTFEQVRSSFRIRSAVAARSEGAQE